MPNLFLAGVTLICLYSVLRFPQRMKESKYIQNIPMPILIV